MRLISTCDDMDFSNAKIVLEFDGSNYIVVDIEGQRKDYRLYLYKSEIEELIKNLTIIKEEIQRQNLKN